MASTEGREIDRGRADADADAGADADPLLASQALNTGARRRTLDSQQQDAPISRDSTANEDQIDLHEGKHHDEDLRPYQRALINCFAPSLLVNVPRPWPAFLTLTFLHVFLVCFTTWWVFTHCPIVDRRSVDSFFFRQWKQLIDDGICGPDKHVMYSVGTELVDRVRV